MSLKAPKPLPALGYLRECFELRADGTLVWRDRPAAHFKNRWTAAFVNAQKTGKPAGKLRSCGYRSVKVDGVDYAEHRIVYALFHGVDPGALTVTGGQL